jgi:hypothetical protein
MKTLFRKSLKLAAVTTLLLIGSTMTAQAQGAKLQMDQLDFLANKASETVDVKLDEHLMQMTARFFSAKDPDEAKIKEIIKGVKGIYVKSFTFEKENEYSTAEVDVVMAQLRGAGWNKVLSVISRKDGQNVEVFLNTLGDQINGLAVLSIQPKELTIVNIVGPVDLQKLSSLEGQFGVPDLDLEKDKTEKPKKP